MKGLKIEWHEIILIVIVAVLVYLNISGTDKYQELEQLFKNNIDSIESIQDDMRHAVDRMDSSIASLEIIGSEIQDQIAISNRQQRNYKRDRKDLQNKIDSVKALTEDSMDSAKYNAFKRILLQEIGLK